MPSAVPKGMRHREKTAATIAATRPQLCRSNNPHAATKESRAWATMSIDAKAIPPRTTRSSGDPAEKPGANVVSTEGTTILPTNHSQPTPNAWKIPETNQSRPRTRRCEFTRLSGMGRTYAGWVPADGTGWYAAGSVRPQLLQKRASDDDSLPHRSQNMLHLHGQANHF